MFKYTASAPENVPSMTLGNYVRKAFPLLSDRALRDAFAKRDVKMDGVRSGREEMIKGGAEVTVFTPAEMLIPVAYEDAHLLVLDKPAGISTDEDAFGGIQVPEWARMYAKGAYEPRLCHRLDNQTCGLVALAKDEKTENALKAMFANRTGKKEYYCLVRGTPRPAHADAHAYLLKDPVQARVHVSVQEKKGAKPIETEYEVVAPGKLSLLHVTLHTGRTHQIRAHLAYLGHPIAGDDLYGDRAFNKECGIDRLMLCSARLCIDTEGLIPEIDGMVIESTRIDELKSKIK